jgi:hypothetical protein
MRENGKIDRMIGTIASRSHSNRDSVMVGALLLLGGLVINYMFERHNAFAVWVNSAYPVSWMDLLYPPLCVFLCLMGIVFAVGGMISRSMTSRRLAQYGFAIAIPLTILYTIFAFAIQFMQTGADRLGECAGLEQAAISSRVIPDLRGRSRHPAVGCGIDRRGIFLSLFNNMRVYDVTDAASQQRVLDEIAAHSRNAHTHPVQVMFYENENGATFGVVGPNRLIRVVNIG